MRKEHILFPELAVALQGTVKGNHHQMKLMQTELCSVQVSLLKQRLCIPEIQVSVPLVLFPVQQKLKGYLQTAGC